MKITDKRWISLLILLTAPLLSVIDMFIINVAIPSIKKAIKATDGEIQLVIAGYLLGYAVFLITGGRAGDFFGRKKIFLIGLLAFTLLSCLCGLSQNGLQLNIFRFFQGISAAIMVPQTITYIQVLFPKSEERTKAIGLFGVTMGLAAIIGQFTGGWLSEIHGLIEGWRLIFFINLPIGLLAASLAYKNLEETAINKMQKFDYSGVVILTFALLLLVYPLTQGRELGWPSWSIDAIILSLITLIYFIFHQKRKLAAGKHPLINLELFAFRDFNLGLVIVLFFFMMHSSYLLTLTVFLQNGLSLAPFQAGLAFMFMGIGFISSSVLSVKYVIRYGKIVLIGGALIMFAAQLIEYFYFTKTISRPQIAAILFIYGFGNGIVMPSLMNMALKNIPVHFAGSAAGVYSTFQQTASALGISIIGGVFFSITEIKAIISPVNHAFHISLKVQMGFILLSAFLLYLLPASDPLYIRKPARLRSE